MSLESCSSIATNVIKSILENNLDLIDNSYLILNVVDNESGAIKSVCLGEIGSFQTDQTAKYAVSDSSVASELQSDETL
ncbi:LEF-10 [Alphabaculovirus myunipunctae]|uniref:LEF-10 n=1 Tax=Mythimna unipuncta nucleopolyhedrovirus TaxID=447897 RepID=A0A2K9VSF6_9ABAC|nr:LEF-10 [Mythimna unipuncta nucleopolyhedrovirus]AUV65380.1 LEF-10 [Mythimna unipuncta nucleopolyhedrovirus]